MTTLELIRHFVAHHSSEALVVGSLPQRAVGPARGRVGTKASAQAPERNVSPSGILPDGPASSSAREFVAVEFNPLARR